MVSKPTGQSRMKGPDSEGFLSFFFFFCGWGISCILDFFGFDFFFIHGHSEILCEKKAHIFLFQRGGILDGV